MGGNVVKLPIFSRASGLPLPLCVPHRGRDLFDAVIFKGDPLFHLLLPGLCYFTAATFSSLRALPLLSRHFRAPLPQAFSFVDASEAPDDEELHQAWNDHWLDRVHNQQERSEESEDSQISPRFHGVCFPGGEVAPRPAEGFWVMFLPFLYRGLSLPAHEFLHGLLFVYGVQLHQLTPNSILHISCFITLWEAFLGIDPHWRLRRRIYYLCRNASKEEIHDVGGAIIVVRADAQFFKFRFADSVQNWRNKWFYVKDQKSSEAQEYGLAPFDPKKQLKKLKSWDQLPSDVEFVEKDSLMTRIVKLNTAVNKEMNGLQLIVYFHRIRIQPVKARVPQMWTYSGTIDKSRTLAEEVVDEVIQKQVRSLTKLTKNNTIPPCPAIPYSASKPLPKVCRGNCIVVPL
jgi:hypothetical protein